MRQVMWCGGSVAVLAVLCLGPAARLAAQEGEGKRVAVVNVVQVFNAYQRVKDISEELKKEFNPEKEKLETEQNKLINDRTAFGDKEAELKGAKNDALFLQLQQLQLRDYNLKLKAQQTMLRLEEQRLAKMRDVLKDIREAIKGAAKAQGYDVVLRAPEFDNNFIVMGASDNPEENAPKTADQLVKLFRESPVLYYHDTADLTSAVTQKLKDDYAKRAPAPKP